jgi:sortase A
MSKSRRLLTFVSILALVVGLGIMVASGFQIYRMGVNSGRAHLPELTSSFTVENSFMNMHPHRGEVIGTLWIPRLKRSISIIEGTGSQELKMGVGHYQGSVLPGVSDNSVLAGHRDSVFRNLGELKLGDLMTVRTQYGTFVYEVQKTRIVKADDRTVIVPTKGAVLTLSTCYPFRFIGNAPKRYIVQAGLVIGEPIA